jgi:hypothetical protein
MRVLRPRLGGWCELASTEPKITTGWQRETSVDNFQRIAAGSQLSVMLVRRFLLFRRKM